MNSVPRTAMAFLIASLLAVITWSTKSLEAKYVLVFVASFLLMAANTANSRELKEGGISIGFSGLRRLPIAGLNFSALLTLLVMVMSFGGVISESLPA